MTARARHSAQAAHDDFYDDPHHGYGHGDLLLPGERIGPPVRRRGVIRTLFWRTAILAGLAGGGWAVLTGQVSRPAWLPDDLTAFLRSIELKAPQRAAAVPPPRTHDPLPALEPESIERRAAFAVSPPAAAENPPAPATQAPSAPLTTGSLPPPPGKHLDDAASQPFVPAVADPSDPYQVRAAAAGLHPGLSRALLTRLSAADYRNAGLAIQKALAQSSDAAVTVWPSQRKSEEALFKVRFVAGATPDCRRYVVTITKDGWLTTAPPMEKCGPQPRQARRQ